MTTAKPSMRLALMVAATALSACAVGPNYHRPALTARDSVGAIEPGLHLAAGGDVSAQWWRALGSPELDGLVEDALRRSPTVDAAKAALRQAHELVKAQRGAYLPSVSVGYQPSRQRVAPILASPLADNNDTYSLNTAQVSVSYTPDLFGANRRAVEALVAEEDQQRFELEAARLTLASNVALAVIQDAQLRAGIAATRASIAGQEATMASFRRQLALGQVSQADEAAQETLLAQAHAALPPIEKAYELNRDLLAALLGRTPGEPVEVHVAFETLKTPDNLPLSLPSRLVEQRPDVRIAEAQLHAASAQIGVAAAARWPNLQIDAGAGGTALGLSPAFAGPNAFWSVAGNLTQPVFAGGALLHREKAAKAAYEQAAAQYRSTVVGAFQNVADVLHALAADGRSLVAAEQVETAARKSLEIARRQQALGDISPLAVIAAEQAEVQARIALVQAEGARYTDVVALFQALGGGWWNTNAPTAHLAARGPR